jgi:hypothetical protein
VTRALVAGAYTILVVALAWTRLYGLNRSYWHDEIVTVVDFVRAGPGEILAGPYISNNHELFSLLAWMTSSVAGESEVAMRLWSVLPFLAGVALVTAWLHVRVSPLSGVFFLFLATVSPLLLDLSRQARGYGLAFFAMSLLVVAALEAARSERTWTIIAACAAIVGTWTLPIFGVAFLATTATLLSEVSLRRRVAVGLGASVLAIATWYAPHVDDLVKSSRQDYGTHFGDRWLATAPIDQILIPALAWTEGVAATPGPIWIPVVLAALLLMGSSPFLRDRASALVLVSGPIATIVTLWVTDTRSAPRFVSFLLIPLFMLGATGTASILERLTTRPAILRTLVALASLVALTAVAVPKVAEITRLPREAHKEAVAAIRAKGWASTPVFAYTLRPRDLAFYLGKIPEAATRPEIASIVCSRHAPIVLVVQPFALPSAGFPCVARPGAEHIRLEQYARGDQIDVWFVPPAG